MTVNEVDQLQTQIFAHRGASHLAPENTIEAFKLAYEMGANGIETDVQLTKDRVPVLIHDPRVDRTTNGQGFVKDMTFAELSKLDAGSWFSDTFSGTKIVSLDQFLTWIKRTSLLLNLELKNSQIVYEGLEAIVYEKLRHHRLLERTTISTFSTKSIERLQKYRGQIEIGYLTSKGGVDLVSFATEIGADAIHINYRLLNRALLSDTAQHDLSVRVYTVNRRMHLMTCLRRGVAGIFTDVPNKAVRLRTLFLKKQSR